MGTHEKTLNVALELGVELCGCRNSTVDSNRKISIVQEQEGQRRLKWKFDLYLDTNATRLWNGEHPDALIGWMTSWHELSARDFEFSDRGFSVTMKCLVRLSMGCRRLGSSFAPSAKRKLTFFFATDKTSSLNRAHRRVKGPWKRLITRVRHFSFAAVRVLIVPFQRLSETFPCRLVRS